MSTTKTRLRSNSGIELWRTALTISGDAVDAGFTVKAPSRTPEVWNFDRLEEADAKFDELVLMAGS